MLKDFTEIINTAKEKKEIKISVAAAQDVHVLRAVYDAYKEGIVDAILVGNKDEIRKCLLESEIPLDIFEIEHVPDDLAEQSKRAVELIVEKKAQVLMKGLVDTSILLKAVLKEQSLRTGRTMSAVGIMNSPYYHKLFLLTDAAMNIKPDSAKKKQIIENAVEAAKAIGITNPKAAVLCAKEKVDEKMSETLDAQVLKEMNERGEIKDCIVDGPLAFDNIISKEAAEHKGIKSVVSGDVDIILAPDLVSANSLYKTLIFLGGAKSAGIIMGAKVPIVLTSRADSEETKMYSIAVAALIAGTMTDM